MKAVRAGVAGLQLVGKSCRDSTIWLLAKRVADSGKTVTIPRHGTVGISLFGYKVYIFLWIGNKVSSKKVQRLLGVSMLKLK